MGWEWKQGDEVEGYKFPAMHNEPVLESDNVCVVSNAILMLRTAKGGRSHPKRENKHMS